MRMKKTRKGRRRGGKRKDRKRKEIEEWKGKG